VNQPTTYRNRLDPVDFVLAFPYRRVSPTDAVVKAMLDRIELI
jgi:hypothetical protein